MATRKPSTKVTDDPHTSEDVRRRAYELYEERGRGPGHLEDWQRAEELTHGAGRAA